MVVKALKSVIYVSRTSWHLTVYSLQMLACQLRKLKGEEVCGLRHCTIYLQQLVQQKSLLSLILNTNMYEKVMQH
jgi:hypothetical protein